MLVLNRVPLRQRNHNRPALAANQIRQCQILPFDIQCRVNQHHNAFGKANGTHGIGHRHFLDFFLHTGFAANARGVPQLDVTTAPVPRAGNRVTGDTGLRPGQHPLFAQHGIDQCGLARIGLSDNGQAQGALGVIFPVLVGFFFCDLDVGIRHIRCLRHDDGAQRFIKTIKPFGMFSRNRQRLTKSQAVTFSQARHHGAGFRLVTDENDMLVELANARGKFLVRRCHTSARVDHKQNDVGLECGYFRLVAHARLERAFAGFVQTGGVIQGEGQLAQAACTFAAVTGDAGCVINNGNLLADKPIEKRGFPHIGSAQNSDNCGHWLFEPAAS